MPAALWPLLSIIWSDVSPELKALALTELKALEVAEEGKPFVEMAIKAAEALLSAA